MTRVKAPSKGEAASPTLKTLRFVLGDQVSHEISSLSGLDAQRDVVLMVEVADETTYVGHHKQKIAFIFSAMRHFAAELTATGVTVDYVKIDDAGNAGSFTGELQRAVVRHAPDRVVVTEPGEWRVWEMMRVWSSELGLPVTIEDDDRYFCSRGRFARWAEDRKSYRMEFFYREMRRETGLLMRGDEPEGDRWNFDTENRKRLPATVHEPNRRRFEPDAMTREVLDLVAIRFSHHFGDLDGFGWAVTRADALEALEHFIRACLPLYGDYQDAMKADEPFLFHAVVSPYLNAGLLTAREICVAAERAYQRGEAGLNAVEGFIRQILGWREYIRGIYWLRMPGYADTNVLGASRPLPWFYWSGETDLNCIANAVGDTRRNAYAHHIQRLMVTGNFALLAGIEPRQVEEWYLAVYADAYEWAELPNVHGMALFADGGLLASKPYIASGAYIDRMSDYCGPCRYDPKIKSGPNACPFNALYWNFLIENQNQLGKNARLAMPYRTLAQMRPERRDEIVREAGAFLAGLSSQPIEPSAIPVQATLDV
ncbi:cryptochrome/photolyase family protein [Lichenihabitans sp. PAMC28606]|uniref:cryptochrome/photolyase family protein n=1 Tax=Lichenihabitans sp. PAMC28606 TaxID=2880932 RepID=UPI001D09DCC2|nr:cryptochrome/photolyase family protein [Lichenihabitans sp. PAMC28606]UDL96181.1 cryptochrome/photolyase family protein [Lichenihabitans sp. PAMC28606]